MLNGYMIIGITIFIAVVMLLCVIFYTVQWFRNQTKVNANILYFLLLFAMGIIVDCSRLVVIFGVEEHFPSIDFSSYIVKLITIFLAFFMVSEVHIVLSDYVDLPKKHENLIRYYLLILAGLFSVLGIIYSFITVPVGPYDLYFYQFDPTLYFIIFFAYIPVAVFVFYRNWAILQSVRNKKIKYKLMLFTLVTVFLIAERGFSLGGFYLVNLLLAIPVEFSLLVDIIVLTIISVMFFIIILKYDIFQSIGTYFSIKKLYVLKSNGILIFDYEFEDQSFKDGLTSEQTLMGGFIYAVTETFKEILKSEEQIKSFSSGNRSVLIQNGDYVFGVLIVTEDSYLLHQKLLEFIKKFEAHYQDDLKHWTGEFSKFDRLELLDWIHETLRED